MSKIDYSRPPEPPSKEETIKYLESIKDKPCCGNGCMSCVKRTRAHAQRYLDTLIEKEKQTDTQQ